MRIDLLSSDGVIQATANVAQAVWDASSTQITASATAKGFTIDTSPLDDTADAGIRSFQDAPSVEAWISQQGQAWATGPNAAVVAPAGASAGGTNTVLYVAIAGSLFGLIVWAFWKSATRP